MTLIAADLGSAWTGKMSGSGTGVGLSNAEDVSDIIIMIDPTETPLLSALPRKKATGTLHEWIQESLLAAANNVGVEGQAWATKTIAARSRVGQYCQISDVTYEVSGTQQAVTQYGVDNELARQAVLSMKELKRDIDLDLWQGTSASGDNAAFSGRSYDGFHEIKPSAHTGDASYTASEMSSVSAEASFNNVLNDIYDDGPSPNICYMLPSQKGRVSRWEGVADKTFHQAEMKIINVIDVYQSDFGTVRFVMDRYMEAAGHLNDAMYVGNWDNAAIAMLRPFTKIQHANLPKDATAGTILVEYCPEYGNVNSYGALLLET